MNQTILRLVGHDVDCIIGVWAHEKQRTQRVGLELELRFDSERACQSDDLSDTINYAQLLETSSFILCNGRFDLLETAASMIWHHLMLPPLPTVSVPTVMP